MSDQKLSLWNYIPADLFSIPILDAVGAMELEIITSSPPGEEKIREMIREAGFESFTGRYGWRKAGNPHDTVIHWEARPADQNEARSKLVPLYRGQFTIKGGIAFLEIFPDIDSGWNKPPALEKLVSKLVRAGTKTYGILTPADQSGMIVQVPEWAFGSSGVKYAYQSEVVRAIKALSSDKKANYK